MITIKREVKKKFLLCVCVLPELKHYHFLCKNCRMQALGMFFYRGPSVIFFRLTLALGTISCINKHVSDPHMDINVTWSLSSLRSCTVTTLCHLYGYNCVEIFYEEVCGCGTCALVVAFM